MNTAKILKETLQDAPFKTAFKITMGIAAAQMLTLFLFVSIFFGGLWTIGYFLMENK
jgi:hypothetical protein